MNKVTDTNNEHDSSYKNVEHKEQSDSDNSNNDYDQSSGEDSWQNSQDANQVNDDNQQKDNKESYIACRYKTCYLKASPKKLLMTARYLKHMTINNAIKYSSIENKAYSKLICKSLKSMHSNMLNIKKLDPEDVKNYTLGRVIIEKQLTIRGIRYHARGGSARSTTHMCMLNIYFYKSLKK